MCYEGFLTCLDNTLRLILIVLNFATLMTGGILLGCGIYVKISSDTFEDVADEGALQAIDITAYVLIALGLLVILLSLMGCLGACLQNHVLLGCYFVLMLLLVLSQIGVGILYAIERATIEEGIDEAVKNTIDNYGDGESPADTAVNIIQKTLKCCGYESWKDFSSYPGYPAVLPSSCCEGEPTICTPMVNSWSKGCKEKINQTLESQSVLVIIIVSSVALLEILTMLMACYLRKRELADIDYNLDNPPYSM